MIDKIGKMAEKTLNTIIRKILKPVSRPLGIAAIAAMVSAVGCDSEYPDKGFRDQCTHDYECPSPMVCDVSSRECRYPDDQAAAASAEFIEGSTIDGYKAFIGNERLFSCPLVGDTIYASDEFCEEL